ncbi:MAG: hypothetical protein Ct9H300mP16_10660 [Pseudomonadota bacterium]|nr:MAG: hypothetical protein Ct9H300mP16_10660 [Pseudomonadota bacterium]
MGAYLISPGYRISEASLVAPFEYTGLIFANFWRFFLWGLAGFHVLGRHCTDIFRRTSGLLPDTNERLDLT